MPRLTREDLDHILCLQFSLAWAGEAPEETDGDERLKWWHTDLLHPDAGMALFEQLFPRTALWAALRSAFEEYWFGMRSEARVRMLVGVLKGRFDRHPEALSVLRTWPDATPDERMLVCHWHVQLSDPLYQAFTGDLLPASRSRGHIRQQRVVDWLERGERVQILPL